MKNTKIEIRCTEELKGEILELAKKEGLSVSAYITRLLTLEAKLNKKEIENNL